MMSGSDHCRLDLVTKMTKREAGNGGGISRPSSTPASLELRAEGDGSERHLFNGGQGFVSALYTIPTRKP